MEKIYDKCCGIDVHKKLIVVCFRFGNKQEIREFGAMTKEILKLADWLKEGGCEMAAMESTASYWKPLYNILEYSGLNAMVVNAHHMKAVPGRKTDAKDAQNGLRVYCSTVCLRRAIFRTKTNGSFGRWFAIERALSESVQENSTVSKKCWREQISNCPVQYQISMAKAPEVYWSI